MGEEFLSSYTVSYNTENHLSVLTQCWGSIWPKVLPYCILNVALMVLLTFIDKHTDYTAIEISTQGHNFITLVVAFLLVSRVNMGLTRFNSVHDYLCIMYREAREVIQYAVVLSKHDPNAAMWRHEVAYRTLILLRTAMVVIDYPVDRVAPWDIPELNGMEKDYVQKRSFLNPSTRRWSHGERTVWEECMRVPIQIAFLLRSTVHDQSKHIKEPIQIPQETKLLGSVDSLMAGYYGIRRFLTTPVPFPLIQMSRTFLFLYVFTVPFVMLKDDSGEFAHCFTVFLLTFGFVGLEIISIELDNPFGDDENDFDNSALAMTAYEDTYLTILDIDGTEWTDKLRARMYNKSPNVSSEQTWLLSSVV